MVAVWVEDMATVAAAKSSLWGAGALVEARGREREDTVVRLACGLRVGQPEPKVQGHLHGCLLGSKEEGAATKGIGEPLWGTGHSRQLGGHMWGR